MVDVQAQVPRVQLGLSRVGVTDVEKVIRMRQNGAEQLFSARFECVVELGPDQKGAHMSRFEEVVNEAIGEVVLGESTFKAETLAEHIAQLVRTARAPAAPRSTSRPASPSTSRRRSRASRPRSSTRCTARRSAPSRHPPPDRRHGPGHDRMPVRSGAGRRVRPRATRGRGLRRREIERIFEAVPVATHNQRGLGTLLIGCTEQCDDEIDAATLLGDRRAVDVVGDLRADEALRRGPRGREGSPPPAVRRGLRARDDPRRRRRVPG